MGFFCFVVGGRCDWHVGWNCFQIIFARYLLGKIRYLMLGRGILRMHEAPHDFDTGKGGIDQSLHVPRRNTAIQSSPLSANVER